MPKPNKFATRQTRRDERSRMRNDAKLLALLDTSLPPRPEQPIKELVKPLTDGQRAYDTAFKFSSIVYGVGPAGTGKTWFAVQRAAEAYKNGLISKIYVTRPAIEVGASLGFLPGELNEKYEPYLAPLKEAFIDAFGKTKYEYLVKAGIIEAVPLAFMRGRTIKNAWLIADEMQNATQVEFKMLLTRIGEGAKFVVNGDPTQVDQQVKSGLMDAIDRTKKLYGVTVVTFDRSEIVRSGLTQQIVEVYEGA